MRVGYQHSVNRRQIAHAEARTAKSLENEDPLSEVGIDHEVLSSNLEEEAGVTDEGDAQLSASDELGPAGLAGARGEGGTADEGGNLSSFAANGGAGHEYRLDAKEGARVAEELKYSCQLSVVSLKKSSRRWN